MFRSYRYRLYPTRAQERQLQACLDATCEIYNAGLQERTEAWKKQRISRTLYQQFSELADVRNGRDDLAQISLAMLRGSLKRLSVSFARFFLRVKAGQKPGYPRYKGRGRWRTLDIDDFAKVNPLAAGGKRLHVPLVGKVRIRLHRPLGGIPKAMRLTFDGSHWWASIACVDVPTKPLAVTGRDVGVDVGLSYLAVTSDGEFFGNPRHGRTAERRASRAQRRVSKRIRGSRRRAKAVLLLRCAHRQVKNRRRETAIQIARSLARRYDRIYIEDLNLKGLSAGRIAKSFGDAGLGILRHWITCKAEEAGRELDAVPPKCTSQLCSECGAIVMKTLSERVHRCSCGYVADRDVNAARNILRLGRSRRRELPEVRASQRPEKPVKPSAILTTS